jgi:uncharacterized protein
VQHLFGQGNSRSRCLRRRTYASSEPALSRAFCSATVLSHAALGVYGREAFLRRLAHPFWFQSFGAVMGMDWHSSGMTTSVIEALKRGLAPLEAELGLYICGGRGKHSRRTPDVSRGHRRASPLARASSLVAKWTAP